MATVVAYDDPSLERDVATYREHFGLPPCRRATGCLRTVNEQGASLPLPPPDRGWAAEEALDVETISAVCPDCRILVVEATSPQLLDLEIAVTTAAALGAYVINNSYGTAESPTDMLMNARFAPAGAVVTAASGDSGYGVMYPAADPGVIAVGGTSLEWTTSGRHEVAWSWTGGGCSEFEVKPSWQHDTACPTRMLNDVAAFADPEPGVAVYNTYQSPGWMALGGTSVSSAIMAGVFALGLHTATAAGSQLYAGRQPVADITSGRNGSQCTVTALTAYWCEAGVGYDGPTGLGSPSGIT